jgi:hypothetical protein
MVWASTVLDDGEGEGDGLGVERCATRDSRKVGDSDVEVLVTGGGRMGK